MLAKPPIFNYYSHISSLPTPITVTIAEYIWIDGSGINLRSKSVTLNKQIKSIEDIPESVCDGKKLNLLKSESEEIVLKPVFYCLDPFRGEHNILVLCATYELKDDLALCAVNNFRSLAVSMLTSFEEHNLKFGFT